MRLELRTFASTKVLQNVAQGLKRGNVVRICLKEGLYQTNAWRSRTGLSLADHSVFLFCCICRLSVLAVNTRVYEDNIKVRRAENDKDYAKTSNQRTA